MADDDAGFAGTAGVHMIETAVSHHERRSEARGNDDKVEVVVDVSRPGIFQDYSFLPGVFDELFAPGMTPRDDFAEALAPLTGLTPAELRRRNEQAAAAFLLQGVTFSVYSNAQGSERIFPFCLIPRLISAADWERVERGLAQRIRALEAFLGDIYGERRILSAPRIPAELIVESKQYLRPMIGITPPGGVRIHLAGIDLIRDGRGTFRVLEDNLRCPSGVSYVLENRDVAKRVFPEAFRRVRVRRVDAFPGKLAEALRAVAPAGRSEPVCMVLTPGRFNSAYFEHAFLARTMGLELVEASDLFVDRDIVYVRTTAGPKRVDVLYRRTDEAFLDPEVFRPDSLLGVPGIMRAYKAGNIALCNAPGNGVADDKAVYALVPEMIRFYLGEEPLLDQVETYLCAREDDRKYVLDHLSELVVKTVDEAGGYGMLMGPQATTAEREEFASLIRANPRRYIAQPLIELSSSPTWIPETGRVEPRRVDLRPYIINSPDGPWVLRGGLTRVALKRGSYVVNSSQGGGSKDTWVLDDRR